MVTATVTYALTPSKSIGVANCSIEKLIKATPPITCISTLEYYDPHLLVALPHQWPFLITPDLRPHTKITRTGDVSGGTLPQEGGDLARCADAAHRARPGHCEMARGPWGRRGHAQPRR